MNVDNSGFEEAIGDDEVLALFVRRMKRFGDDFCRNMFEGTDFTLKLEIHGNQGKVIHSRVVNDSFERPIIKMGSGMGSKKK